MLVGRTSVAIERNDDDFTGYAVTMIVSDDAEERQVLLFTYDGFKSFLKYTTRLLEEHDAKTA